jgi:hypothetical protein
MRVSGLQRWHANDARASIFAPDLPTICSRPGARRRGNGTPLDPLAGEGEETAKHDRVTRAQSLVILAVVALAIALAGIGFYAEDV